MRASQKIIILLIILSIIAIIVLLAVDYSKYWWIAIILGVINVGLVVLYRYRRRKKRKLTYIFKLLNKYIPGTKHIYEYRDEADDSVKDIHTNSQFNITLDPNIINILINDDDDDDDEIILGSKTTLLKSDPNVKETIKNMIDNINKDKDNNINDKLFLLHSFLIGNDIPLDQNKLAIFDKLDLFKCRREIKSQFVSIKLEEIPLFNKNIIGDLVHLIWLHQTTSKLDAIIKQNPVDEDHKLYEELQTKIDDKTFIYTFNFDALSHDAKILFKNSLQTDNFADAMTVMDIINIDKYNEISQKVVDYVNKYYLNHIFEDSYVLYDKFFNKELTEANMYDMNFIQAFNKMIIYNQKFVLPNNPYNITNMIIKSINKLNDTVDEYDEKVLNQTPIIRQFLYDIKKTYINSGFLKFCKMYDSLNGLVEKPLMEMLNIMRYNYFSDNISFTDRNLSPYYNMEMKLSNNTIRLLKEHQDNLLDIKNKSKSYMMIKCIDKFLLQ